MNRKNIFLSGLISLSLLTACGSNRRLEEITAYKENVADFAATVRDLAGTMDAVDLASGDSADSLLLSLSQMDEAFQKAADLTAPEGYENCDSLCTNASAYMHRAFQLYENLYGSDTFDPALESQARDCYHRAMDYLNQWGAELSK